MKGNTKKQPFRTTCSAGGMCLALSMLTAMSVISITGRAASYAGRALTSETGAKVNNTSEFSVTEIPINIPVETGFDHSGNLYRAYKKIVASQKAEESKEETVISSEDTLSTTSTTSQTENEQTTVTTTMTSRTSPTVVSESESESDEELKVSNGQKPFNYADVSSIASDMNTLGDFMDRLAPSSVSWNAEEYSEKGYVRITLDSVGGSVVLDVKPITSGTDPYSIDSQITGSISGDKIDGWQWFKDNRTAGCNIFSVTWTSSGFGIAPVRGISVGDTLASLTDHYLCVNGGATTLYKASDVISDQNKLNSILAAENLYTFVGGRVYSIGSYLEKYYSGKEQSFRFNDCDYIVQYGCNSIMEHNYTTGSWIIEYAVKEDTVTGISFLNKSYYKTEQKAAVSTDISTGVESDMITTRAESSESSQSRPDEATTYEETISEEIYNAASTTAESEETSEN